MHRIDERVLVTPALLHRLEYEASFEGGRGAYHAILQLSDGKFVEHHPTGPAATPERLIFGRDIVSLLNREINHGGAWVLAFTHLVAASPIELPQYQRFAIMWMDEDGDIQFTMDWIAGNNSEEQDFSDCLLSGPLSWAARCETAWRTWQLHMRQVLDPKPDQMVRAALGETRH